VRLGDVATLVGILGGASVLALFPAGSDLFGAYGIGVFVGFFMYLGVLCVLVRGSADFSVEWFLDGRRRRPSEPFHVPEEMEIPVRPPMGSRRRSIET
jgi:hypothetical protein